MRRTIILIAVCLAIAFSSALAIAQDASEQSGAKRIIYFTAGAWCRPCKMMDATVEKVKLEKPTYVVLEVINTDEQRDAAKKYAVKGVPMIIFLKDGKKVDQLVGAGANFEKIMEKIESALDEYRCEDK